MSLMALLPVVGDIYSTTVDNFCFGDEECKRKNELDNDMAQHTMYQERAELEDASKKRTTQIVLAVIFAVTVMGGIGLAMYLKNKK